MRPFVQPDDEPSPPSTPRGNPGADPTAAENLPRVPVGKDEVDDLRQLHVVRVKTATRRLRWCLMAYAVAASASFVAGLVLVGAMATAYVPTARVVGFIGWSVTYGTSTPAELFTPRFHVAAGSVTVVCGLLSCLALLWRWKRIGMRNRDVGLCSWRDGVTWAIRLFRAAYATSAIVVYAAVVAPASNPARVPSGLQFRACELLPRYTAVAGAGAGLAAVTGNIPVTASCRSSFLFSMAKEPAGEQFFRASVPDHGAPRAASTIEADTALLEPMLFWKRPVGARVACNDAVAKAVAAGSSLSETLPRGGFFSRPLRSCAGTSPTSQFALSNWATLVRSAVVPLSGATAAQVMAGCDALAHATHVDSSALPMFEAEPWFCGLQAADDGGSVRVNYSTVGFSRVIGGACYDPSRGDPPALGGLVASRYGQAGVPSGTSGTAVARSRARALVSSLSDAELAAVVGRGSVATARSCVTLAVACVNATTSPGGIPARPSVPAVRSVSLEGCSRRLERTVSLQADKRRWDESLRLIQSSALACTVLATLMMLMDLIEAVSSPFL